MNEVFRKRQLAFLLKLGLFSVVLGATHVYLFTNFFPDTVLFFSLWKIYIFHIMSVLLIYSVINYKFSNGATMVFNIFMIGTLLKMILAFLFLLPMLLSDLGSKRPDVLNFFIPYFLFLAFEIYSLNFFLNKIDR